jgi:catechol 2,3-dioxygenase-like lactoylglutathione lyase family enzyme
MATFTATNPILCVSDVEASIGYYVDRLGFALQFSWGEEREPPSFAGVARDGFEVFLCLDGQGRPGTWFAVWVDDVDALHAEYVERGADIRRAPVDLPWGVREMNVIDPDGHRIRFSTSSGRHAPPVDDLFGPA